MRLISLMLCLVVSMFVAGPVFSAEIPPIKDIMSREDIKATGLDKLSDAELNALRGWIEVFYKRDLKMVKRQYKQQQNALAKEQATSAKAKQAPPPVRVATVTETQKSDAPIDASIDPPVKDTGRIVSNIDGEFNGWSGKTRFKLKNGQIWKQRYTDKRRKVNPVQSPKVEIDRNFLGYYTMRFPELKIRVAVTLIK